jgi:hypothetical protein
VTHYEMAMSPKLVETALPFLDGDIAVKNSSEQK